MCSNLVNFEFCLGYNSWIRCVFSEVTFGLIVSCMNEEASQYFSLQKILETFTCWELRRNDVLLFSVRLDSNLVILLADLHEYDELHRVQNRFSQSWGFNPKQTTQMVHIAEQEQNWTEIVYCLSKQTIVNNHKTENSQKNFNPVYNLTHVLWINYWSYETYDGLHIHPPTEVRQKFSILFSYLMVDFHLTALSIKLLITHWIQITKSFV